jgi:hypothetical protein
MRTHSVIISSTNFLPLFWRIYWNSSEHSFILIFLKNDYSWIWWILHLRLWIGEYLNFLLGTFATNCYIQKKIIKKIALVQVQKITTFGHELLATQLDNVTTTQQNSTIIILRPLARRWCEKRLSWAFYMRQSLPCLNVSTLGHHCGCRCYCQTTVVACRSQDGSSLQEFDFVHGVHAGFWVLTCKWLVNALNDAWFRVIYCLSLFDGRDPCRSRNIYMFFLIWKQWGICEFL